MCRSIESCEECGLCNCTALSLKKIQILQSPLYRKIKETSTVKKLRKKHRDDYLSDCIEYEARVGSSEDYKRLREYYYTMLELVDVIHYNSSVAKIVYEKTFEINKSVVIPITHADIEDHRKRREYKSDVLRIRYLGSQSAAKGYFMLRDALDLLWKRRKDFVLDVHFIPSNPAPYERFHERYNYSELARIFDESDILVCPSIWHETFGFTVLEALSYGVPVIVSNHVGAKDILTDESGIVIEQLNPTNLCDTLFVMRKDQLQEMNDSICKYQSIMKLGELSEKIHKKLYKC